MRNLILGFTALALSTSVNAAIIDFEEFQDIGPATINTIGGLQFYDSYYGEPGIHVRDASALYRHINLASSGVMGAYISHGLSISTVDGSTFDLISFYSGKTHCCSVYDIFNMYGMRNGEIVYTASNINKEQEARLNQLNWIDIDNVSISMPSDLSGGHFIMDDLEYSLSSVPVPAAAWLFGSGLIGLIGFAKRKK